MRAGYQLTVLAFSFVLAAAVGCGDSPELRMQQAQIAMTNGRPDQALNLINSVLQEKPNDTAAMIIKARAQMLLAHLDDSKNTLDKLLESNPDDIETRNQVIDWTWFRIRNVLSQSDFATDRKLQAQFDEAMSIGQAQTEWLGRQGDEKVTESLFYQSRYATLDAQRLRKMLESMETSLDITDVNGKDGKTDIVAAQLHDQIDDRLNDAMQLLNEVISRDPNHTQACETYASLLADRKYWSELWELIQRVSQAKELPVSTAERLVTASLMMPDTEQPKEARLDASWHILSIVKKSHQDSPRWKITSARLHLFAGEWEKAQPLLEGALKSDPSNIEAQYFLAQSLYGLQKYPAAKAILEKLSTKAPRSSLIQTLYGLVLMQTKDSVLAKEALRRATELNPDDSVAREAFLALMAEEGHIEEAQDDIDAYLKRNPADPRAIRFKMQFEQSHGRHGEVVKLLERVEGLSPLADDHLRVLIDGYLMVQDFEKAQQYARLLVKRRPDALESHMQLAQAMLMQGKDEQVKQMLAELRDQFPDAANINQMLGSLYLQRQSYDRAVDLLQSVVEQEPNNTNARILLAQGFASLSMIEEAIEQLDRVIEQDPQEVRAHALAARIAQFAGRTAKANEHLAQIDENRINELVSPALLAQIKLRKGEIDEAAAICNRAVASGNTDPVLRMLMAGIYIKKNDLEQAENNLLALVKTQPNNIQAYSLLSRFYLEQNSVDKGLVEMTHLQSMNEPLARLSQASLLQGSGRPVEALARLEPIFAPLIRDRSQYALMIADAMARLHVSQGNTTAAHAVYEALADADLRANEAKMRQIDLISRTQPVEDTVDALDKLAGEITPDQRNLRYNLLARYKAMNQHARGVALLDEWLTLEPDHPSLLRWKGELLSATGQHADAIEAFNMAINAAPENTALRLLLAQEHVANYDYPKAEKTLLDATEIDSGAKIVALASLGRMFLAIGLNRQAAETFQELERFGRPSDPRVIYAMGQAYAALKMDDLARQRLEEVPTFAPQYGQAQFLLARIDQNQGRVNEAKQRLESLVRNPRTATIAAKELLALSLENRQAEDLIQWSDDALRIESLSAPIRLSWLNIRVKLASNAKDWSETLDTIEQMCELSPQTLELFAARILVMTHLNRNEQARRLYLTTPGLAQSPFGPTVAVLVGEKIPPSSPERSRFAVYLEALAMGDIDAARSAADSLPPMRTVYRSDLLAILDRSDVKSQAISNAARQLVAAFLALNTGLPQLAIELTEQVSAKTPSLIPAHAMLAEALHKATGSLDKATAVLKGAPGSALAIYIKAYEKTQSGDYAGSAEQLSQLLEKEPGNYLIRYEYTQRLQLAGQIDKAIANLTESLKSNSPMAVAERNDLAYLLAENHPDRLDDAYAMIQKAITDAPNVAAFLDTLGWIEHLKGSNQEALQHLSQAVAFLKQLPALHYHLGAVYAGLGNNDWARYHLQEAAASTQDSPDVMKAKTLLKNLTEQLK